jgi:hypothetical protein
MTTELYVFGSLAEGTIDADSDVDVLAVTADASQRLSLPQGWCVYTPEGLQEMFREGRLFAWHLHFSAVQVWPRSPGLLNRLGQPAEYRGASAEIRSLITIASDAVCELTNGTPSIVYELGLLYLCARDVAMAAAPTLLGRFEFSRLTPCAYMDPEFPLSLAEYEYLMRCRRAGTRGSPVPDDRPVLAKVLGKTGALMAWLRDLEERTAHGTICC